MKQNKFVQFIAILVSALVQIGIFFLILTSLRTTEESYFNLSILPSILQVYSLVTLSVSIIGGLIYGGYYVKKYKKSWMVYIRKNILNPIHSSIIIGCVIQVANLFILGITIWLVTAQAEELRPQLNFLLVTSLFTLLITIFLGVLLEACFYENDQTYLSYKGASNETN